MIIVIQARSDSKRFPKKIYKKLNNKTILENIIDNLKILNLKICVCSTKRKIDKKIKIITEKKDCFFFGGSKNNVIKRLYECVKIHNADCLIRVNGDSPLISAHIVKKAILWRKKFPKHDIITNVFPRTFPKGMSVEIIEKKCLAKLNSMNLNKSNKEHVTKYIYENPQLFNIKNFKCIKNFSSINLSIDTKKDLKFLKSKQNLLRDINTYKQLIYKFGNL